MLRNKYAMIVVGIIFVLVAAYNIAFFQKRGSKGADGYKAVTEKSPRDKMVLSANMPLASDKAVWKRNPFGRSGGKDLRQAAEYSSIKVDAISVGGQKGYAIINGRMVGVGDEINGLVITAISRHSITVKDDGKKRDIPIY